MESAIECVDKAAISEAMKEHVYDRDLAVAGVGRWLTLGFVNYDAFIQYCRKLSSVRSVVQRYHFYRTHGSLAGLLPNENRHECLATIKSSIT